MGRRGESRYYLISCMQMSWFCVVGRFVEVCRRRGQKVNAGTSKVMEMNGEEGF